MELFRLTTDIPTSTPSGEKDLRRERFDEDTWPIIFKEARPGDFVTVASLDVCSKAKYWNRLMCDWCGKTLKVVETVHREYEGAMYVHLAKANQSITGTSWCFYAGMIERISSVP